jgi:hypothetical protein
LRARFGATAAGRASTAATCTGASGSTAPTTCGATATAAATATPTTASGGISVGGHGEARQKEGSH